MAEFYHRYSHLVYGVCLKYLKNVDDAQDTLMYIFEKLMTVLSQHEIKQFKPWLYQLSKNECLMRLRKQNKVTFTEVENMEWQSDYEESLSLKLNEESTIQSLHQAIEQLNEKQKICIQLFYLKKLSYQEIEKQTNFSLSDVKSAIQNGKRNLKLLLDLEKEKL